MAYYHIQRTSCARTVREVLRSNTPCFAHSVKSLHYEPVSLKSTTSFQTYPCFGWTNPGISWTISWYMFLKEGGTLTPFRTEKARPWACPSSYSGHGSVNGQGYRTLTAHMIRVLTLQVRQIRLAFWPLSIDQTYRWWLHERLSMDRT